MYCMPLIWFARGSVEDVKTMDKDMGLMLTLLTFSAVPIAAYTSLRMIYTRVSKTFQKAQMKTILRVRQTVMRLIDIDQDKFNNFMRTATDWDFSTIDQASNIFLTELFALKIKRRLTNKKLEEYSVVVNCKPQEVEV